MIIVLTANYLYIYPQQAFLIDSFTRNVTHANPLEKSPVMQQLNIEN